MAGADMTRYRNRNRIYAPMLRPYETADRRWLQFNMIRDEEMLTRLLVALDAVELLGDSRFPDLETIFGEARESFGEEIQKIVRTKSATEWLRELDRYGLPVNLVATVEEAAVDEQVRINAMAVEPANGELDTPWIINHPVKVTSVAQVGPRRAPALGEHSREILGELGYSPEEIDALVPRAI